MYTCSRHEDVSHTINTGSFPRNRWPKITQRWSYFSTIINIVMIPGSRLKSAGPPSGKPEFRLVKGIYEFK